MTRVLLTAPALLTLGEMPAGASVERDAVLLECCDLPDKQLTLGENDLDGIAARFTGPVPVKVQHVDSPLDPLGHVQRVWRDGKRLLGKIVFPPAVASFVRERGAVALSCGLDRDPLTLAEVSLVVKGRLPAATLLADDERVELARLRAENAAQRVEAQLVALKLAGKVVPATEEAARVLLSAGDGARITLADGASRGVAEAFAAYLDAQPPLVTLGELTHLMGGAAGAAAGTTGGDAALTPDQRAWLQKSLGVDPDQVEARMKAEKSRATGAGPVGSFPARKGGVP